MWKSNVRQPSQSQGAFGQATDGGRGSAWEADSKGSSSASHLKRLAAARRRALAASMSLGGGGVATHLLKNAWRSCFGSSRAISGSCLTAAAKSVGKIRNTVEASWGPGEGPGGAPPRRGGIQRGELACVQNRKVVVQVQDAMLIHGLHSHRDRSAGRDGGGRWGNSERLKAPFECITQSAKLCNSLVTLLDSSACIVSAFLKLEDSEFQELVRNCAPFREFVANGIDGECSLFFVGEGGMGGDPRV